MTYSIWILLLIFIAYIIITDSSVARLFVIISNWTLNEYEKLKWRLLYLPSSPIVKWNIHRNSLKLARELQKELDEKNKIQ